MAVLTKTGLSANRAEQEPDVSYITRRARLRPASFSEVREAGLLDGRANGEGEQDDTRYWFTAEISSEALDSYFTHMSSGTLRNFARNAAEGVSLLDSHDGHKLGVGYSAGGRYEEENGQGRALGIFYIVRGIRFGGKHSYASTDDLITAIENGVVRDVSVGFYGGRWICDLCHQPYFGPGSACNHWAGFEYEIERDGKMVREVCTVQIDDAHLSEVSLVFDGATPGAMILKAEQAAEDGRLTSDMTRQLEMQYRVKLPGPVADGRTLNVRGGFVSTTGNAADIRIVAGAAVNGARVMEEEEVIETVEEVVEEPAADAAVDQAGADEARAELDAARQALTEIRDVVVDSGAPEGATLAVSVRWLNEQLAKVTEERDRALGQVAELQPLADQGREYRSRLVEEAVAEGVRAMSASFPEETYRAMLENAPLEHIRKVKETFAAQAAERFPGGRQTRDETSNGKKPKPEVPAAAYGVK